MPLIGSVMSSIVTSGLLIGKGGVVGAAPKLSTDTGEAVEKWYNTTFHQEVVVECLCFCDEVKQKAPASHMYNTMKNSLVPTYIS